MELDIRWSCSKFKKNPNSEKLPLCILEAKHVFSTKWKVEWQMRNTMTIAHQYWVGTLFAKIIKQIKFIFKLKIFNNK